MMRANSGTVAALMRCLPGWGLAVRDCRYRKCVPTNFVNAGYPKGGARAFQALLSGFEHRRPLHRPRAFGLRLKTGRPAPALSEMAGPFLFQERP